MVTAVQVLDTYKKTVRPEKFEETESLPAAIRIANYLNTLQVAVPLERSALDLIELLFDYETHAEKT